MKPIVSRSVLRITLSAAMVVAICLCASGAHAQSAFRANLTLPYKVQWGRAVLPAGSYIVTFNGDDVRPTLVIRDAKTFRTVALEGTSIEERSDGGTSALVIGMRGGKRIVGSFRIAEFDRLFVYEPAFAHESATEEAEADKTRAVPLVVAEK